MESALCSAYSDGYFLNILEIISFLKIEYKNFTLFCHLQARDMFQNTLIWENTE